MSKENTLKDSNAPARAIQRRKIDAGIIAQMARLVAKMHTETHAARLCGIKPSQWFEFKSRAGHSEKWADLMEKYRAELIDHNLDRVQKSADGVDTKYPDFRAALALLKFQDPKRFGEGPAVENHAPLPAINLTVLTGICDKLLASVQTTPKAEPKQLPAPPKNENHDNPA